MSGVVPRRANPHALKVTVILISMVPALCPTAWAEDATTDTALEYVVTANRVQTLRDQVASSTSVITSADITERGLTEASEVLRAVPGLDVVQSGGLGGNTAVFIRGANSEHTLVLLDGVALNNPISNARFFNFSSFTLEDVERIEVVRGPQSTQYGSDALGGVINIITKRGSGPAKATVSVEGGSQNSFVERGTVSGSTDRVNYSASLLRQDTDGISAADAALGNTEEDGFHNLGIAARVGITPDRDQEISLTFRRQDSTSELDNGGGVGQDDPNRRLKNSQYFVRAQAALSFLDGQIKPTAGVSYVDEEFRDNNDPDSSSLDFLRSVYHGSRLKFDLQQEWKTLPWLTTVIGAETEEERGDSEYRSVSVYGPYDSEFEEQSARHTGYYAQLQGEFSKLVYPVAGIRIDTNSGFGSEVTWRAGPTVNLKDTGTKVFGTVGTGFKAPSLYQRYSEYGSSDLDAERSVGVDAGLEQRFAQERLLTGITYFHNDFDHLIDFDPNTFKFLNVTQARSEGIESFVEARVSTGLTIRANYTLTNTRNLNSGEDLIRRARHKVGSEIRYTWSERAVARLNVLFVGRRADTDFSIYPSSPATLGGYATVNLAASYPLTQSVELFARIDNLFDRSYQEVFGYGVSGVLGFGGLRVTF
ncbi:MAG: TonB-dependent receptor [Proteobacteria bacterium]|nr:TonB-dependent receptor [Pseudomonadota bacterium]